MFVPLEVFMLHKYPCLWTLLTYRLLSLFQHEERAFVLKFSAIEIYNEAVRDLLSEDNTPLRLLDDPEVNVSYLVNSSHEYISVYKFIL
jgi:hypothetical protein